MIGVMIIARVMLGSCICDWIGLAGDFEGSEDGGSMNIQLCDCAVVDAVEVWRDLVSVVRKRLSAFFFSLFSGRLRSAACFFCSSPALLSNNSLCRPTTVASSFSSTSFSPLDLTIQPSSACVISSSTTSATTS